MERFGDVDDDFGKPFGPLPPEFHGIALVSGARWNSSRASSGAMVQVAWDSLGGRQKPSAFHESPSGEPAMPLTVLSSAELARLRGGSTLVAAPTQRALPQGCS